MRPETVLIFLLGLSLVSSSPTPNQVNRIVNGEKTDIKDVPYQAILQKMTNLGWSFTCGGAVITTRFVLTAAHCVRPYVKDPEAIRVIVGSSMRNSGGTAFDVLKLINHHSYSPLTLEHDISMIKTKTSMNFDVNLKAVDIPTPNFNLPDGSNVLVSGYGLVNYDGMPSAYLRAAYVNVVPQELCRIAYRDIIIITDGMLCAGADNPPRDACQGDSGGPLVYENTIVGIVSFGEECANITYPGVYTRSVERLNPPITMCNAIVPAYYLAISQNNLHRITSTAHGRHTHVSVATETTLAPICLHSVAFPFRCVCVCEHLAGVRLCACRPHIRTPRFGVALSMNVGEKQMALTPQYLVRSAKQPRTVGSTALTPNLLSLYRLRALLNFHKPGRPPYTDPRSPTDVSCTYESPL
ncbi:unnamed protein product [Danaus chrysippus]|uniref:(African queen) hypothetical protein n=1 Tax=Danaus chrysippus TaxID=151541 RepID=A0A8J2QEE1_9NEOP|nr:unnamed protein product [Danaus chrysippus]